MKRPDHIVLASASPRRRALLAALGIPLEVIPSAAIETLEGDPEEIVMKNAQVKCDDIARTLSRPALVIAADTLVFLGDSVLGKPAGLDEAKQMLRRLSGQTHIVRTGIAVADTSTGRHGSGAEATEVTFRTLSEDEIELFVEAVNPVDRAGAYTVDGPGSLLISRYNGCYQNVLGLPIVRLDIVLRSIGYSLIDFMVKERALFL